MVSCCSKRMNKAINDVRSDWILLWLTVGATCTWHGILVSAIRSGKGFLSNLGSPWPELFFLLPLFTLLLAALAAKNAWRTKSLKASHLLTIIVAVSPFASFVLFAMRGF